MRGPSEVDCEISCESEADFVVLLVIRWRYDSGMMSRLQNCVFRRRYKLYDYMTLGGWFNACIAFEHTVMKSLRIER